MKKEIKRDFRIRIIDKNNLLVEYFRMYGLNILIGEFINQSNRWIFSFVLANYLEQ